MEGGVLPSGGAVLTNRYNIITRMKGEVNRTHILLFFIMTISAKCFQVAHKFFASPIIIFMMYVKRLVLVASLAFITCLLSFLRRCCYPVRRFEIDVIVPFLSFGEAWSA